MGQYKNIRGRRYYKSLASMTKSYAEKRAKEYRRRSNVLVRVSPDPDNRGYYAVYTAPKKKR